MKTPDFNRYLRRSAGTYAWTERLVSFAPPVLGLFLFTVGNMNKRSRDMYSAIHLHYDFKNFPRTDVTFSQGNHYEVREGTGTMSLVRCGDLILRDDGALLLSCGFVDATTHEGVIQFTHTRYSHHTCGLFHIDTSSSVAAVVGRKIA